LYALELQVEDFSDGADQQGLCQAGHSDEQRVSIGKQGNNDRAYYVFLTDDDFADFF